MLYHVSYTRIPGDTLIPRVPKQRAEGENDTIKRICFADTLEACFTAMPQGGQSLRAYINLCRRFRVEPVVYLYGFDEYERRHFIFYPKEIQQYCVDSLMTREHWAMESITITPRLISVIAADFKEITDDAGNTVVGVRGLKIKRLRQQPRRMLQNIVACHNFRTFMAVADGVMKERGIYKNG